MATISTQEKALRVNLDPKRYGTIAEIGAGQEVARHFFQAGAAAGTIAKTMSAYDMQVSDAIYGEEESGRYVSRTRAQKMITREYDLLIQRLKGVRPPETTFFAFANTMTAKSFRGKNDCHGWMGIKVQLAPDTEPCEILLHVRMFDSTNQAQQNAVGILGVNLLYGIFYHSDNPYTMLETLNDNLGDDRIEIDFVHVKGPQFENVDNRLLVLHLVKIGLTDVAIFSTDNQAQLPSEELYKKDVIAIRGTFRPITKVNIAMVEAARTHFMENAQGDPSKTAVLFEMNMAPFFDDDQLNEQEVLNRIEMITSQGYQVMISRYLRYFRLSEYLAKFCRGRVRFVLSVYHVRAIFNEDYYEGLPGGTMMAIAKLFADDTKLYVYPNLNEDGTQTTIDTLKVDAQMKNLYIHLKSNLKFIQLNVPTEELIPFGPHQILENITAHDESWTDLVPEKVVEQIKSKKLFGYE